MPSVQELKSYALNRIQGRYDASGILLEIGSSSDILVISCSGIVPGGRLAYAMENTSKNLNTDKLFVCDKTSTWYYQGLEGISASFDETVQVIGDLVKSVNAKRTCVIGTSGGGYMALVLASILKLDRALALSPQTTVSLAGREALGDRRWQPAMAKINSKQEPHDVKTLLQNNAHASCHIVYPSDDQLDCAHATRLEGLENAYLHRLDTDNHNTSAELKHRGCLRDLLETFIRDDDQSLAASIQTIIMSANQHSND